SYHTHHPFVDPTLACLSSLYIVAHFFFSCYVTHRDLPSFPTRRSSDLGSKRTWPPRRATRPKAIVRRASCAARSRSSRAATPARSEERRVGKECRSRRST